MIFTGGTSIIPLPPINWEDPARVVKEITASVLKNFVVS